MNQLILIGVMLVAALLGSVGQIMLQRVSTLPITVMPFSFFAWGFVACYGIAVVLNLIAYRLGLSAAVGYPIIATSYIFVLILAWKFLGEQISGWSIAGTGCIILGVGLIGWGAT